MPICVVSTSGDSPDWRHFWESHVTDGEPETVVSASLQKMKPIKNPIKHFFNFLYFIKSHFSIISMVILHT